MRIAKAGLRIAIAAAGALGAACGGGEGPGTMDGRALGSDADSGAVTCASNSDCMEPAQSVCSPPGQSFGCEVCEVVSVGTCNVDSDCRGGDAAASTAMVCGPPGACLCPSGGSAGVCIPACHPSSCGVDEMCSTTGHCVAKTCTSDADCPKDQATDYACSAGVCGVKTCATNGACGGDYCVNGACYTQPGVCVGGGA